VGLSGGGVFLFRVGQRRGVGAGGWGRGGPRSGIPRATGVPVRGLCGAGGVRCSGWRG